MPKVTIDGREEEFEDGLTVIRAAEQIGIEIPHYCWHPGLTIAGNCRMCLVEIEKVPKLQIACNTRITEGMVVSTAGERVKRAQESVLEFLLVNHPIDCPICDQAGECKLQDYYMDFDAKPSRFALEQKNRKRKVVDLGPRVVLDQERCILCLRCTRFLDEVSRTSELGVYARGDRANIDLAPGKTLDNPYSENVVDVCPVGALTSKAFRFQARVWYLQSTPSVCTACARGCNIDVYHREGTIYRHRPRYNPDVNEYWMCDAGRDHFRAFQGEGRLIVPEKRTDESLEAVAWDAALEGTATGLQEIATQSGGQAIGVIVSAGATNEEVWLAKQLASSLGGARVVGHAIERAGAPTDDDLLIRADRYPNRRGLEALEIDTKSTAVSGLLEDAANGSVRALVVVGCSLMADLGRSLVEPAYEGLELLAVVSPLRSEDGLYANWILPTAAPAETTGSITNFQGRVQRLTQAFPPPGDAREGWRVLGDLVADLGGAPHARDASEVFEAAARGQAALSGLSWEVLGNHGALLSNAL